jgi:hypothetical protein
LPGVDACPATLVRRVIDQGLERFVCEATGARAVRGRERVQSLWGGYGELVRLHLDGGSRASVVLKDIAPPRGGVAPDDEAARSHTRKCRSYDVEVAFYRTHARHTNARCRVPEALATHVAEGRWRLLLEDLDAAGFPLRRRGREAPELAVCLRWLAAFHAAFLGREPRGLWPKGTYWHLDTRPDELARTRARELHAAAAGFDRALDGARFQTLVHGDAKPANFGFTRDGSAVAAVDFQYVGGGCGMKDVAYLLYGELSPRTREGLIELYFLALREALSRREVEPEEIAALEAEWRGLYPIACADFVRFLAGWAPGSYERDAEGRAFVQRAIAALRGP